jgi:hypothetical protein
MGLTPFSEPPRPPTNGGRGDQQRLQKCLSGSR